LSADLLFHVLLALAVVVISGRLTGRLVAAIGQPPVIGEVLSGILLGPSLLGRLAPGIEAQLFPPFAQPALAVVAQLGVVLYMFAVGSSSTPRRPPSRRAVRVHVAGEHRGSLPARCGLATFIYPDLQPAGRAVPGVRAFMGVAMSITAFRSWRGSSRTVA
jgi:Kef-type K+ transport system membrane component KefB